MDKANKKKFIISYLNSSKRRIKYIEDSLNEGDYAYVVRVSQEVFELLTKSLLLKWNFVVPKSHNLSSDLKEIKELCSQKLQNDFDNIITLSKELRRNREIAFYGDEEEGITPNEIYTKKQAEDYYERITDFYNLIFDELKDFLDET